MDFHGRCTVFIYVLQVLNNIASAMLDDDSRARGEGTSDSRGDMQRVQRLNYACITFTVHRAGHANIHLSNETVTIQDKWARVFF